jgi:hypothetical protein
MGDAGVVQTLEVAPESVDGLVGRAARAVQPVPVLADDDEGVALSCAAGGHDVRNPHPSPLGEQRHEALVLDELHAAQPGRPRPGAVPRQAPQRRQQLSVPCVSPVHLDGDRPRGVAAAEAHDPTRLHRRRREVQRLDPQPVQGDPDAGARRTPTWRTDHEVHGGSREHPDRDRREAGTHPGRTEHDDPHDLPCEQPSAEVAERSAEVRRGDGDGPRRDRDRSGWERRRPVEVGQPRDDGPRLASRRACGGRSDDGSDDDTSHDVPNEPRSSPQGRRAGEDHGPRECAPRQPPPEWIEERRKVSQHVRQACAEVLGQVREDCGDDQSDGTGERHGDVGRTPRAWLGRGGCEQHDARTAIADRRSPHRRGAWCGHDPGPCAMVRFRRPGHGSSAERVCSQLVRPATPSTAPSSRPLIRPAPLERRQGPGEPGSPVEG